MYADPTIAKVRSSGTDPAQAVDLDAGKTQFDAVRAASDSLQAATLLARDDARHALANAATLLIVVCVVIATVLLALFVVLVSATRGAVAGPLARLAASVRQVADGGFDRRCRSQGPASSPNSPTTSTGCAA